MDVHLGLRLGRLLLSLGRLLRVHSLCPHARMPMALSSCSSTDAPRGGALKRHCEHLRRHPVELDLDLLRGRYFLAQDRPQLGVQPCLVRVASLARLLPGRRLAEIPSGELTDAALSQGGRPRRAVLVEGVRPEIRHIDYRPAIVEVIGLAAIGARLSFARGARAAFRIGSYI